MILNRQISMDLLWFLETYSKTNCIGLDFSISLVEILISLQNMKFRSLKHRRGRFDRN